MASASPKYPSHLFACPAEIDLTANWQRLKISKLWAEELLAVLDNSRDLQGILEEAVASWVSGTSLERYFIRSPWRYADPKAVPPFLLSHCDAAVMDIEGIIADASDAGDQMAQCRNACRKLIRHAKSLPIQPRSGEPFV